MGLMNEIIEWAKTLPYWQQLAVKGILENETFNDEKIKELAKLAIENKPNNQDILSGMTVSDGDKQSGAVALTSISELSNINNLQNGGKIEFPSTGLTVVYGENGVGKSGYSRILKKCCRSRDKKCVILKNIHDTTNIPQSAKVFFTIGDEDNEYEWQPSNDNPPVDLQRVHIFDRISADVYLSGENDIEYKPFGMDTLDHLVAIMQKVKTEIDTDKASLTFDNFSWADNYGETKATKLIKKLDAPNAREEFDKLIIFTEDEESSLIELTETIPAREKSSPEKEREQLKTKNEALKKVASYIEEVISSCSKEYIDKINNSIKEQNVAKKNAEDAKKLSFDDGKFLGGTGNEVWKLLWGSAKRFAEEFAYKGKDYPPAKADKPRCVLCQQELDDAHIKQMDIFSKYVLDESQQILIDKNRIVGQYESSILEKLKSDDDEATLVDTIKTIYPELYEGTAAELHKLRKIINERILSSISNGKEIDESLIDVTFVQSKVDSIGSMIKSNDVNLAKPLDDEKYKQLIDKDKAILAGLESRKDLLTDKDSVINSIENHKKIKSLNLAAKRCNTVNISNKSGELSKKYIVATLEKQFDEEIRNITNGKVGAKLVPTRIAHGVPMSKIVVTLGDGTPCAEDLVKVLSDGELRGASIAGFMAELSMDGDKSTIVFDDPISSLDHIFSQTVADRICKESAERQVIVFTHDILFLTQLTNVAEANSIDLCLKTIRAGKQAGVVEDELPPEKMKLKSRIGRLRNMLQAELKPLYDTNKLSDYQDKGKQFYKELRQSWERFVEERLFGGVVMRFDNAIHTQQLKDIDLVASDIDVVTTGMTNCSQYLHDQPDIQPTEVGEFATLKEDLKVLEDLSDNIIKRRKK